MNVKTLVAAVSRHEAINFLLTNRVPRAAATRFMGWFSRLEQPWLTRIAIAVWQWFGGDLQLHEARHTQFSSLQACFTRELKPGARPIEPDPGVIVSPCDGIVGACGRLSGTEVLQAKGSPYRLEDLLVDPAFAREYAGGTYVSLRLRSTMYHRFHAPYDGCVEQIDYVTGEVWNVNPIALRRIDRLYCRNERAAIRFRLDSGAMLALVPVAAILVASIRLHFVDVRLHLRYRGPNRIACATRLRKGEEMGWFEHGSTLIVFAPAGHDLCATVTSGASIRVGEPLLRMPVAQPCAIGSVPK